MDSFFIFLTNMLLNDLPGRGARFISHTLPQPAASTPVADVTDYDALQTGKLHPFPIQFQLWQEHMQTHMNVLRIFICYKNIFSIRISLKMSYITQLQLRYTLIETFVSKITSKWANMSENVDQNIENINRVRKIRQCRL